MASRVRVLTTPGQSGTNPTGTIIPITDGSVTFDATAQVTGQCDITTTQPWPVNASDLITCYGNEVYIERGVTYATGTEWVGLGYYRIDSAQQRNAPNGTIAVPGSDRMASVIDAKLISPQVFTAGTTVASVITSLVQGAFPFTVQFAIDASLSTQTLAVDNSTTNDRYQFLSDLVAAYGMIMYWDYRGYFVVKPVPTLNNPVATIATGRGGVITEMSREISRAGVYNAAVVSGTAPASGQAPFAAVADTNPSSPTYFYGRFGQVPQFISSSLYTSVAQCQAAGVAALLKTLGLPYEMDFGLVPNPALELWDPILVSYNSGQVEPHILKHLEIGLKASDSMTAQTRQLLNASFGVIA